jgi:uncharacterized membrane protein YjjP (DUF1212 family)
MIEKLKEIWNRPLGSYKRSTIAIAALYACAAFALLMGNGYSAASCVVGGLVIWGLRRDQ